MFFLLFYLQKSLKLFETLKDLMLQQVWNEILFCIRGNCGNEDFFYCLSDPPQSQVSFAFQNSKWFFYVPRIYCLHFTLLLPFLDTYIIHCFYEKRSVELLHWFKNTLHIERKITKNPLFYIFISINNCKQFATTNTLNSMAIIKKKLFIYKSFVPQNIKYTYKSMQHMNDAIKC